MPTYKIAKSLYEPVTIEVEGGRIFESVPLSPALIREITNLEEQRKAKTIDEFSALTQQVALIFGIDPKEVETIDLRILNEILTHATEAMAKPKTTGTPDTMTVVKASPNPETGLTERDAIQRELGRLKADEAQAEKNASTPGSEISL